MTIKSINDESLNELLEGEYKEFNKYFINLEKFMNFKAYPDKEFNKLILISKEKLMLDGVYFDFLIKNGMKFVIRSIYEKPEGEILPVVIIKKINFMFLF